MTHLTPQTAVQTSAQATCAVLLSLTMALAFSAFSAFASASATETSAAVVGTSTRTLTDPSRARTLITELWFEALPGTPAQSVSILPPIAPVLIAPNAQPAPGMQPRPLIVLSHGNWGTRFSLADLAMALVRSGYLVLSLTHPGTTNGDMRTESRVRLWDRSLDASFALTQLLQDPAWAARIDAQRIGFVGHSFGGWAGVSLAGGRFDSLRQLEACRTMAPKDLYCETVLQDNKPEFHTAQGLGNFKDRRIKAFYLLASGPGAGFTPESLRTITVPMLFETAQAETVLAPHASSTLLAQSIPGAREVVRGAGHFSYVPLCRPLIGWLLARQICTDPAGIDRRAVHARVNEAAIAFFNAQLARP